MRYLWIFCLFVLNFWENCKFQVLRVKKRRIWYSESELIYRCFFLLFVFFFFFVFSKATPTAYGWGSNQSCCCQSMPEPQPCRIRAASGTYTTARGNAGPLAHWSRPGIKPAASWFLVRFVNHWATTGTPIDVSWCSTDFWLTVLETVSAVGQITTGS